MNEAGEIAALEQVPGSLKLALKRPRVFRGERRLVLEQLGNPVLASAAYNAGPARARRWRDDKPLEGAIYVETIPFPETRDYVKKVMANAVYYAAVLDRKPATLKSRLGVIQPPGVAEPPVEEEIRDEPALR